jgi:hypothetical protein
MNGVHFSWLTAALMLLGWMTHWFVAIRKIRKIAEQRKLCPPTLRSYWTKDPYALGLSVIGVLVLYLIIPTIAPAWPQLAAAIGSTPDNPLNPLAAYLGGIVAPWLGGYAGKRISRMLGERDFTDEAGI